MPTLTTAFEIRTPCSGLDYKEIEGALRSKPGVTRAAVDRTSNQARVSYDPKIIDPAVLKSTIEQQGFTCDCSDSEIVSTQPAAEKPQAGEHVGMSSEPRSHEGHSPAMIGDMFNKGLVALALTIPVLAFSSIGHRLGFAVRAPFGLSDQLIGFMLTTPIVFWCGWVFLSGALRATRQRQANMMTLIALGIIVSYVYSVFTTFFVRGDAFYDAAAMLTTFSLIGHWLEMRSRFATGKAVEALLKLAPSTAIVVRNGNETEIPLEQVVVADEIIVKPGARVPVDGTLVRGSSYVDESMISGEPIPVKKETGAKVIGGTVNQVGNFAFKAAAVGSDTALSRIVKMVQEAQASKAPAQEMADRAGKYLVFLALISGVVAFSAWGLLGAGILFAITAAVSTIVIACPDALALATPTAITVGVGKGAREGVLFKNATALESTASIQVVVFDKTGTLTLGKPALTDVSAQAPITEEELIKFAAAADSGSEHPLARAIVEGARAKNVVLPAPTTFEAIPGFGVRATVDGSVVLIGNAALMKRENIAVPPEMKAMVATYATDAKTPMHVAVGGAFAGLVAVADVIRASAIDAIKDLHAIGIRSIMITGDNEHTARAVARALGIDDVLAEVFPGDKATQIKKLQQGGKRVAMVGDGVNDAPALAQADVGIAIGAGTDVAVETAEVVLVNSDPASVAIAIRLARSVRTKIVQNLYWAAIYNVLAIPIAAGVLYPAFKVLLAPEWAALLMSVSTISVTVNALMLNRLHFKRKTA